jgi:leucine dehydrogenase
LELLKAIAVQGHEQVIAFQDAPSGLRGFLAIHSTRLGPALGGVRLMRYQREADALADALRLSRAMTYKCALAGLPCGGGKAVIVETPALKRRRAFEAYGRIVQGLGGRFYTGGDIGIRPADLEAVGRSTDWVAKESSPALGDVNQYTAEGVWQAMRACLEFRGIAPADAHIALQGVGNVGIRLARILAREGCRLTLADLDTARARRAARALGAAVVSAARIDSVDADVFAPCALGGVLRASAIRRMRARIVCGAANNQLETAADATRLQRREVLYAPDYLANAGGVIRGAEYHLLDFADSHASIGRIYDRMRKVARRAKREGVTTVAVADAMAEAIVRRGPTGPR